ncbi:MAG: glycosyltransferase [Desulfovibrionaceae bacterium]|nr:glycosyltransferase [Desulfovibrionaceae bacterium]
MRILFCNNSFPGQFEALAGYFAARPEHTVLFASSYGRRDFSIAGVRRILLKSAHERAPKGKDEFIRQWTRAVNAGREARGAFTQLKQSGYEPDVTLFTAGCGESLFLKDVFPDSFRAAYLDLDRHVPEEDDEKSAFAFLTRSMALFHGQAVFALSGDPRGIPDFLRPVVGMTSPFVDTDFFRPESAAPFLCDGRVFSREREELVSIDGKGLSETDISLAVALLLRKRPDCHVLLAGCDCAGTPPGVFAELARACPGRLHLRGVSGRAEYRDMLAASTVHVCPSPRSRMRELMEALSCGALLLARPSSTPGTRVLIPGKTMLTWPDSTEEQVRLLHHALDDRQTREALCRNGRKAVRTHHAQETILPRHVDDLLRAYERWKGSGGA